VAPDRDVDDRPADADRLDGLAQHGVDPGALEGDVGARTGEGVGLPRRRDEDRPLEELVQVGAADAAPVDPGSRRDERLPFGVVAVNEKVTRF
jgi:hypothetical protein